MTYYEKDFIMRQVNGIAKALGKFMSKEAVDELLSVDEKTDESFTDPEIKGQFDLKIDYTKK